MTAPVDFDPAALLAQLHPFRGPLAEPAGLAAEALAALALGLALGAAVAALRRRPARPDPFAAALAGEPEGRLAATLSVLRDAARPHAGEEWAAAADRRTRGAFSRAAALSAARAALYGRGPLPDPDAALAEARAVLRRLRRSRR